jgi:hypothetical protein
MFRFYSSLGRALGSGLVDKEMKSKDIHSKYDGKKTNEMLIIFKSPGSLE